eukprot:768438-Hanusia_phi.AAC.6
MIPRMETEFSCRRSRGEGKEEQRAGVVGGSLQSLAGYLPFCLHQPPDASPLLDPAMSGQATRRGQERGESPPQGIKIIPKKTIITD